MLRFCRAGLKTAGAGFVVLAQQTKIQLMNIEHCINISPLYKTGQLNFNVNMMQACLNVLLSVSGW